MFSVSLARRFTSGQRRALLDQLQNAPRGPAEIIVATPRRFLSTRKLIRPNEAIDGMLQVMTATQALCRENGLTFALATTERMPPAPRLLLSHHTFNGPAHARLRDAGAIVRHFKAADIPGATVFDPDGFSGWSSLARQSIETLPLDDIKLTDAQAFFETTRASVLAKGQSKYAQDDAATVPHGDYVFVALQTIGDLVQRQAFLPMLDMLDMVVQRFAGTGMQVVVKRHPKCRSRQVTAALAMHNAQSHVIQSTASIHRLLAGSKALFTVNSGVGSEAMIHDIPIYCFGGADYAPIAHQIDNASTLAALTDPVRTRCDTDALHRFHYYYRKIYQTDRATGLVPRLSALLDDLG